MATEFAREQAAQCWCDETTKHLVLDPVLAEVFATKLDTLLTTLENDHTIHDCLILRAKVRDLEAHLAACRTRLAAACRTRLAYADGALADAGNSIFIKLNQIGTLIQERDALADRLAAIMEDAKVESQRRQTAEAKLAEAERQRETE